MEFDIAKLRWINKPAEFKISHEVIKIVTEPQTDLWQKTYYGFSKDNAHALLQPISCNFTFLVKVQFDYKKEYDQCGVLIYQDNDNWFKASVEFGNSYASKLGSVVTGSGYSDWATTEIAAGISKMWYRLSRKGRDFLIENSYDGLSFNQMRIFHMNLLNENVNAGIYACSPLKSSFTAIFTEFQIFDSIISTKSH